MPILFCDVHTPAMELVRMLMIDPIYWLYDGCQILLVDMVNEVQALSHIRQSILNFHF
jgi:hypothetical protein